jgi:energy-converting hydrogenase Eha subunit C
MPFRAVYQWGHVKDGLRICNITKLLLPIFSLLSPEIILVLVANRYLDLDIDRTDVTLTS